MDDDPTKDIDTLLDQVEVTFLNKLSYDLNQKAPSLSVNPPPSDKSSKWTEVDELLKEFQFEVPQNVHESSRSRKVKTVPDISCTVKCIPPYLGGSYDARGYSVPGLEKSCNCLGCVRCDFKVVAFDNFQWDSTTDYLFLRTHMPQFNKLAKKLVKANGTRAYACQCQFVSVSKMTHIGNYPDLKWICKTHEK